MREYELWMDESGDFEAQTQSDTRRTPSLAGGILIPSGAISDAEIRRLADPDGCGGHAMEMSYSDAQRIVPDALEGVVNRGGRLVYFENQERIDDHTNRDLYLRVLASGLAQLVKALAVNGSFLLKITVRIPTSSGLGICSTHTSPVLLLTLICPSPQGGWKESTTKSRRFVDKPTVMGTRITSS